MRITLDDPNSHLAKTTKPVAKTPSQPTAVTPDPSAPKRTLKSPPPNPSLNSSPKSQLEIGSGVILDAVHQAPLMPGCYRMLDESGRLLYIGKAKALPKRLASYTRTKRLPTKTKRMIALTRRVEFTVTRSEAEALLLEANLIRKLKPRYNILLKDDKSFPQILIRRDHDFPQLTKFRGKRKAEGDYFGPFANAGSINTTVVALQRAFLLRNCSDKYFAQRKRPCLQYQIRRCSAPCVGYVSKAQYKEQADSACQFLRGKNPQYRDTLVAQMEQAAAALEFERAAELRNRLRALAHAQARQDIHLPNINECDLIAFARQESYSCVHVFFFRDGQNFGDRAYFPRHQSSDTDSEILESFIGQFYAAHSPPAMILLSRPIANKALLQQALKERSERKIVIKTTAKYQDNIDYATNNAVLSLRRYLNERTHTDAVFHQLMQALTLSETPERIEIYDNAHLQGDHAVGAMVVADHTGFVRTEYRQFRFRSQVAQDDYAMMREMLTRRFLRTKKQAASAFDDYHHNLPDLIVIDGGKGHLSVAKDVLDSLEITNVMVVAAAKGADRIATEFYALGLPGTRTFPEPVRLYLNQLQDEAHRYANRLHRKKRSSSTAQSILERIPGVGPGRKRALVRHFGSAQAVAQAKESDLQHVAGISSALARTIHEYLSEHEF